MKYEAPIYIDICPVAHSVLDNVGEMHAHRNVESDAVALPSPAAQPSSRWTYGGTAPGVLVRFTFGHCWLTIGNCWCFAVTCSIVSAYIVM